MNQEDLDNLHCQNCNKILSVAPILMKTDGSSICGRCPNQNGDLYRNYPLEKLLCKLSFTCIHEGCNEKIPWGRVRLHEEKLCHFKPFFCRTEKCLWIGKKKELGEHFRQQHRDMHLENRQAYNMDLSNNFKIVLLHCSSNIQFLIKVTNDFVTLNFHFRYVICDENSKNICLQLNIKNEHDTVLKKYIKNIEELGDGHDYENTISFQQLSTLMKDSKVSCSFKLKNYTNPTKNATVACSNDGCFYFGKKSEVRKHLLLCKFKTFNCIFPNCSYTGGLVGLEGHCYSSHSAVSNYRHEFSASVDAQEVYTVIINDGHVFYFKIRQKKISPGYVITFEVTLFGRTSKEFKYNIELINRREKLNFHLRSKVSSGFLGTLFINYSVLSSFYYKKNFFKYRIEILKVTK